MTITEQLDEWDRLAKAATAGPWETIGREIIESGMGDYVADAEDEPDAAFIAASREAVPRLVKALLHALETADKLPVHVRFDSHPKYIAERHAELAAILEGR